MTTGRDQYKHVADDPVQRMHAAVLVAGECLYIRAAHFSTKWRVRLRNGTELQFSEPTGNRLMLRDLIDLHPAEKPGSTGPILRFVPVATRTETTQPPVKETAARPSQRKFSPTMTPEERQAARRANFAAEQAKREAVAQVRRAARPMKRQTKREIMDVLEAVEIALSSMVRRWDGSIPPEVREEIMTEAYEPVLRILIQANRRGVPWTSSRR